MILSKILHRYYAFSSRHLLILLFMCQYGKLHYVWYQNFQERWLKLLHSGTVSPAVLLIISWISNVVACRLLSGIALCFVCDYRPRVMVHRIMPFGIHLHALPVAISVQTCSRISMVHLQNGVTFPKGVVALRFCSEYSNRWILYDTKHVARIKIVSIIHLRYHMKPKTGTRRECKPKLLQLCPWVTLPFYPWK
jgi:hypothetical protein